MVTTGPQKGLGVSFPPKATTHQVSNCKRTRTLGRAANTWEAEGVKVTHKTWRDVSPQFRIRIIDEMARCLIDWQHAATAGRRPLWSNLNEE